MTRGAEDGNPCREENRGRNLFIQIFVDFILLLAGNYIYSLIYSNIVFNINLFTKLFLTSTEKGSMLCLMSFIWMLLIYTYVHTSYDAFVEAKRIYM